MWLLQDRSLFVGSSSAEFAEAPWDAPLDADAAILLIPESATISGMFPHALSIEARRRGFNLPSARQKYVPFTFYPLREHARLLVEASHRFYPQLPLRQALRRIGSYAVKAMAPTTLGRVMFGGISSASGADGVLPMVTAMVKAYPINTRPCGASLESSGPTSCVLRLNPVYHFADSHHVGAFEGIFRYLGVDGRVRSAPRGPAAVDLLLEWGPSLRR